MQNVAELPVTADAGRILTAKRVLTGAAARGVLGWFLLPSYGWLSNWLAEARDRAFVSELWGDVFGEPMPYDNVFDAEVAFAQRVDRELFPLDLLAMDDILGMAEYPVLSYPIQVYTYGVPWEMCFGDEISWRDVPMVAAVHAAGLVDESPVYQDIQRHYDFGSAFENWIGDWWARQGYETEPVLTWPRDRLQAMARLRRLPPPLDGLAGVYAAVVKETGSVFFDWPNGYGFYRCEYSDDCFFLCWCSDCVDMLAKAFAAVREDVRRMMAYYDWFNGAGSDGRRVIRALVELEE